jgi:hypothetical protein
MSTIAARLLQNGRGNVLGTIATTTFARLIFESVGQWIDQVYAYVGSSSVNWIDSAGLFESRLQCECCVDYLRSKSPIKDLDDKLASTSSKNKPDKKCEVHVKCSDSSGKGGTRGGAAKESNKGQRTDIDIYWKNMGGCEPEAEQFLHHELIHALQNCLLGHEPNTCRETLCREIEAYYNSLVTTHSQAIFEKGPPYSKGAKELRDVIIKYAVGSALSTGDCKEKDNPKAIADTIFEDCIHRVYRPPPTP